MKMAKKFLAVALAGVLALSVLTGCGDSVKSKDIADSLTKMGVKVEQSKDVDKTAENTLKAIETIIAADSANKITLDNAVEKVTGKVISQERIDGNTDATGAVQKALGVLNSGSDAEKANCWQADPCCSGQDRECHEERKPAGWHCEWRSVRGSGRCR